MYAEAETSYSELEKNDPGGYGPFYGEVGYRSALGRLLMLKGAETSGRKILEECLRTEKSALAQRPQDARILYRLAAIEASLGETDPAIADLRNAAEHGWVDYRSLQLDPRFDLIRGDSRYREIVDSMNSRMTALRVALVRELEETDRYRGK